MSTSCITMAQKSSQATSQKLTRAEVAKNNTEDSLWVIIDHKVYDLTDFLDAHPGGSVVLQQVAGQDATQAFYNLHRHEVLQNTTAYALEPLKAKSQRSLNHNPVV